MPDAGVHHAPLGVVGFTGSIVVDVFLIELSVVHVRFLHNLGEQMQQIRPACGEASHQNIICRFSTAG